MSSNTMIAARRFSEGMERTPPAAWALRIGRFADGTAQPVALSADQVGSFADGLVKRPAASTARRVGSFGDGSGPAGDRRPARVRRPLRPARAHA